MKKWFCVMSLLVIAMVALPAYAGEYNCTGTVTIVFVNSNGIVAVGGPGGLPPIGLCALDGSSGIFNTNACKAAYATLLAAKLSGQSATISFNDTLTCSTQPAWGGPTSTSAWSVYTQ